MRLMKEGCQEGYQQGVAAEARRTKQSCGVTASAGENRSAQLRETKLQYPLPTPNSKKPPLKNPVCFNHGANNQHRTVTESIIYFRTLDLSLRFLGR